MIKLFLNEKYICPASFTGCQGISCVDMEVAVISTLPAPILQFGKGSVSAYFICRLICLQLKYDFPYALQFLTVTVHCFIFFWSLSIFMPQHLNIFLLLIYFTFPCSFIVWTLCPNIENNLMVNLFYS